VHADKTSATVLSYASREPRNLLCNTTATNPQNNNKEANMCHVEWNTLLRYEKGQ
jgi:hypothetical protein